MANATKKQHNNNVVSLTGFLKFINQPSDKVSFITIQVPTGEQAEDPKEQQHIVVSGAVFKKSKWLTEEIVEAIKDSKVHVYARFNINLEQIKVYEGNGTLNGVITSIKYLSIAGKAVIEDDSKSKKTSNPFGEDLQDEMALAKDDPDFETKKAYLIAADYSWKGGKKQRWCKK